MKTKALFRSIDTLLPDIDPDDAPLVAYIIQEIRTVLENSLDDDCDDNISDVPKKMANCLSSIRKEDPKISLKIKKSLRNLVKTMKRDYDALNKPFPTEAIEVIDDLIDGLTLSSGDVSGALDYINSNGLDKFRTAETSDYIATIQGNFDETGNFIKDLFNEIKNHEWMEVSAYIHTAIESNDSLSEHFHNIKSKTTKEREQLIEVLFKTINEQANAARAKLGYVSRDTFSRPLAGMFGKWKYNGGAKGEIDMVQEIDGNILLADVTISESQEIEGTQFTRHPLNAICKIAGENVKDGNVDSYRKAFLSIGEALVKEGVIEYVPIFNNNISIDEVKFWHMVANHYHIKYHIILPSISKKRKEMNQSAMVSQAVLLNRYTQIGEHTSLAALIEMFTTMTPIYVRGTDGQSICPIKSLETVLGLLLSKKEDDDFFKSRVSNTTHRGAALKTLDMLIEAGLLGNGKEIDLTMVPESLANLILEIDKMDPPYIKSRIRMYANQATSSSVSDNKVCCDVTGSVGKTVTIKELNVSIEELDVSIEEKTVALEEKDKHYARELIIKDMIIAIVMEDNVKFKKLDAELRRTSSEEYYRDAIDNDISKYYKKRPSSNTPVKQSKGGRSI